MPIEPMQGGHFESLSRRDETRLSAHLLRLPQDSLRRRFLRPMSGEALSAHAARALSSRGAEVIGWIAEGTVRGVAELYLDRTVGEAAFTVEPEWRGRGIAQALLAHGIRRARNRGCRTLLIMTTRDNTPMVRVAEKAGAQFNFDGGEVTGHIELAPATIGTRLGDLSEEEGAALAEVPARLGRMAAAWMPGR